MEETPQTTEPRKIRAPLIALAVAGVALGGSLIAGIGSFAFAQEATETPSATEEATPEATDDGTADDGTTDDGTTHDGTADDKRECDKDEEDTEAPDDSTTTSGLTF
jgi:hypothetical protein